MISPMILIIIVTIIGAFGSLYLKKASKKFNLKIKEQIKNTNLILGILLFLSSSALYIYALTLERLSFLYPLTSLTYVWVAIISVRFLGEKINKYKWVGILFIMIGAMLING